MARDRKESKAPVTIERFVKQLVVTFKAVMLYPPASDIPVENATEAVELLRTVLQDRAEVRFAVFKEGFYYSNILIFPGQPAFESFSREFYNRNVAEIRFHAGLTARDIVSFLGVLRHSASDLAAAGGYASRLWELSVDSVTIAEASTTVVDAPTEAPDVEDEEGWPPDTLRIDGFLTGALDGRPRDRRMLVRVLDDVEALTSYMSETLTGRGSSPQDTLKEMRITEMIRSIAGEDETVRDALYQNVAEAVRGLDPKARRALMVERLLPEARADEAIASVVRQMDIDEICTLLAEGLKGGEISQKGIARALRNLAMISMAERDDVIDAAGAAMRAVGISSDVVSGVVEEAMPTKLQVRERPETTPASEPVESIMKLIDMAPGRHEAAKEDPDVALLQEEARRGISDGDVVAAIVTLAVVEVREEPSISMMALLEDNIELLVERGEFEVAADAAQALTAAMGDPATSDTRRTRMVAALDKLAGAKKMKHIVQAMRVYPAGSNEYIACRRLLDAFGHHAVHPLLEILADEPDMAARKALVDLMSETASKYVEELGEHVTDPRWYFVRNVVSILGRTHGSDILPFLGRTLRHSDSRVRRETIRALSAVNDRLAIEMLVAGLSDEDDQNVQLAARYLGTLGSRGATAALMQVARGEGRGNRDVGSRVEAIEALGVIRAEQAIPTLEALAGRRSIIGSSRTKEIKAAAESAIAAIKAAAEREDSR